MDKKGSKQVDVLDVQPAAAAREQIAAAVFEWQLGLHKTMLARFLPPIKISVRVYWLATERLKVSNPELGFVSANNWDGVAAVSAGLRTFWIQRSTAEVPEELGFKVDVTVKAITDLPELLRS